MSVLVWSMYCSISLIKFFPVFRFRSSVYLVINCWFCYFDFYLLHSSLVFATSEDDRSSRRQDHDHAYIKGKRLNGTSVCVWNRYECEQGLSPSSFMVSVRVPVAATFANGPCVC